MHHHSIATATALFVSLFAAFAGGFVALWVAIRAKKKPDA
jgi:hypothetical protein